MRVRERHERKAARVVGDLVADHLRGQGPMMVGMLHMLEHKPSRPVMPGRLAKALQQPLTKGQGKIKLMQHDHVRSPMVSGLLLSPEHNTTLARKQVRQGDSTCTSGMWPKGRKVWNRVCSSTVGGRLPTYSVVTGCGGPSAVPSVISSSAGGASMGPKQG